MIVRFSLFLLSVLCSGHVLASPDDLGGPRRAAQIGPLDGFGRNIADSFTGWNLLLYAGGVASTAALVPSGADYEVHAWFNRHPAWGYASFPAVIGGGLLPVIVPGSMWLSGWMDDDHETLGASYAVMQAVALSFTTNSLLKAVTGRPPPEGDGKLDMQEQSRTFRFGVNRGGIFHGWPSGHAMVTMAMVSSLASYYSDAVWLQVLGYGWAGYMVYGVASFQGGGMHWLSDGVAGALMGYAIGSTVGRNMRRLVSGEPADASSSSLLVLPYADGCGCGATLFMEF